MFEFLSYPSTIEFSMPDWKGGVQRVAGEVWDETTFLSRKALDVVAAPLDPVSKGFDKIQDDTSALIRSSANGISSGFKWATFLIVAGIALYAFAVLSPFVPKPGAR